ncbi:MAG: single-stranded DNA-binding protein, partial [Campylobacterota bacterium]|nr:single-stranded DNA-binding protein [Campylobacterota bacterium]
SGKLQTESWTDNQTNQKRSKTVMIVEGFDFVSNKGSSSSQPQQNDNQAYSQPHENGYNQQQGQDYQAPQQQQSYQQPQQMPSSDVPEIDINEDEIPF